MQSNEENPKNVRSRENMERKAKELKSIVDEIQGPGLLLTRGVGEKLLLSPGIEITIENLEGNRYAKVRIKAIPEVEVYRGELAGKETTLR